MIRTELLVAAGCVGLWLMWRSAARAGGRAAVGLAGAGFFLRSFVGQSVFWVSYLAIPLAPRLQGSAGFWFFAPDGRGYFRDAADLSAAGLDAMVRLGRGTAAPFFVQALACFVALFGDVASVGLLFNLYCYLGMCLAILKWRSLNTPVQDRASLLTLGGLAFSPGLVLWSSQPLKDTLFVTLVVVVVVSVALWRRFFLEEAGWGRTVGAASVICGGLYGLGGVRPNAATLLLVGVILALVSVPWEVPARRRRVAFGAVGVLMASAVSAGILGEGPYAGHLLGRISYQVAAAREAGKQAPVPTEAPQLSGARPVASRQSPEPPSPMPASTVERKAADRIKELGNAVGGAAQTLRVGFENTGGATSIKPIGPIRSSVLVGLTALVVPRFLSQSLGLFEIAGGRGLWVFADLDTLVFDAVLACALWSLVKRSRSGGRVFNPLVRMLLVWTVGTAIPLAYVVTNYGTLFRLREMVFVGICLIPSAAWDEGAVGKVR